MHEDGHYYSGHDDKIHKGLSYTAYSLWDTYRAEWPFEILFAPERISGMVTSMLQDYQQGGWLPMWKNFCETNIMVGPLCRAKQAILSHPSLTHVAFSATDRHARRQSDCQLRCAQHD